MDKELKRYIISSGVTFLSGFLFSLAAQIGSIDIETMGWSALGAIGLVALRAGLKMLLESVTLNK